MVHSCLHSRGGEEKKPLACFISRLLLQWAFSWPWTSRSPWLSHLSSFILSFAPAQRLQGVPCNLAHKAQYAALSEWDKDALIAIFLSLWPLVKFMFLNLMRVVHHLWNLFFSFHPDIWETTLYAWRIHPTVRLVGGILLLAFKIIKNPAAVLLVVLCLLSLWLYWPILGLA